MGEAGSNNEGQNAVAWVIINRKISSVPYMPDNFYDVVT